MQGNQPNGPDSLSGVSGADQYQPGSAEFVAIPLLDGGHLLYYTVELVKGSPVSEKAWEAGQKVGIAVLVTLMAFALYNDISRQILG
ncbi:MAG: hypothetical protein WDM70_01445 [Nitrosomonadales bacterium]